MNLENFKRWLELKGYAEETKTSYFGNVRRFAEFSNNEINTKLIEDYIIQMRNNNNSQKSINLFVNSIRKYIIAEALQIVTPLTKGIKKRNTIFPHFTQEQFNNIISHITQLFPEDYEDREFVLHLMFYTGIRPKEELKHLKSEDIDFQKRKVIIRDGKGGKDRYIPFLNVKLVELLKERVGREGDLVPFSYNQINYMIVKIKKYFNFQGQIEPRTFRRSFAKWCLVQGMPINYVRQLMGHEDIKTTEIYAEADEKMIHDKCAEIMERNKNAKS